MTLALGFGPLAHDFKQDRYPYHQRARDETPIPHIESLEAWGIGTASASWSEDRTLS